MQNTSILVPAEKLCLVYCMLGLYISDSDQVGCVSFDSLMHFDPQGFDIAMSCDPTYCRGRRLRSTHGSAGCSGWSVKTREKCVETKRTSGKTRRLRFSRVFKVVNVPAKRQNVRSTNLSVLHKLPRLNKAYEFVTEKCTPNILHLTYTAQRFPHHINHAVH